MENTMISLGFLRWLPGLSTHARKLGLLAILACLSTPAAAQIEIPLYSFTGGADGGVPTSSVAIGPGHLVYGGTTQGGTACPSDPKNGCGTLYSFNPHAGLKVLVTFNGTNGADASSTPSVVRSTLYGATALGGANNQGVLFSVNINGSKFTLLHQFTGTDGSAPIGPFAFGPTGILYGLTQSGGPSNQGVLFSLSRNGTYKILHAFHGDADGGTPAARLFLTPAGALIGATHGGGGHNAGCPSGGCGVIFQYLPSTGSFSVLLTYDYTNGYNPQLGSMAADGTIYGISTGISDTAAATLFSISPAGVFTTVAIISTQIGYNPDAGPALAADGSLWGPLLGGPLATYSAIYHEVGGLVEPPPVTVFSGETSLSEPTFIPSGDFIVTQGGGSAGNGGFFEVKP
jgi:uncharacterized repeat protein (TIGR03803 family)